MFPITFSLKTPKPAKTEERDRQ